MKKVFSLLISLLTLNAINAQWELQNTPPQTDHLFSVFFTDINNGYACGSGTIIKTNNGGSAWLSKPINTNNWLYSIFFPDTNIGYAVGEYGTTLKTIDGGSNWILQDGAGGTSGSIKSVFFVNSKIGYAVGDGGLIIKTTNGGLSWISLTSEIDMSLYSVYFVDSLKWIFRAK